MITTHQVSIAIISLLPLIATAQVHDNPLDFLNNQQTEQLKNNTIALSDPALVKAQAHLYRQHYNALIEVGFSKDEAIKIIVAMAQSDKH